MENNGKVVYFDFLKLVATLAVISIHVSASIFVGRYGEPVWYAANLWDSLSRWCVPVFVMVSGALILPKCRIGVEKEGFLPFIKSFYWKRLGRLFGAYTVWLFLYRWHSLIGHFDTLCVKEIIAFVLSPFIGGFWHLWFLPMIMAMYVFAPVTAMLLDDRNILFYIVVVWFFVCCLNFVPYINIVKWLKIEYAGYFVLGYYLANHDFGIFWKRLIYLFGGFCVILIVVGTILLSDRFGGPSTYLYEYLTPPVILFSVAVFVLMKDFIGEQKFCLAITGFCRKDLFGVYLIHVFMLYAVRGIQKWLDLNITESADGYVGIPVTVLMVFLISLLSIKLLRLIPGVRNFVE